MVPFSPDQWSATSGMVLSVLLFAGAGTWPVCLVIFGMYRRAVARGMRRSQSVGVPSPTPPTVQNRPIREIALLEARSVSTTGLVAQALHGARRARWVFGAAAVGYGLVAVIVFHQVTATEWLPVRAVVLVLIFGWPIVPTLIALSPTGRRQSWLIWASWLAIVITLLAIGDLPVIQMLLLIGLLVALPLIFMLASSARPVRGAAWLVAPALVLIGLAIWELLPVILVLLQGVWVGVLAVPFIAKASALIALVPLYAWVLTRIHAAKLVSDETLLLLQWWLVATIAFAAFLAPEGANAAALALVPYVAFVAIVLTAFRLQPPPRTPAKRLLLLRTFGARQRSTRLLNDLTQRWRWVGSVEMITAPDLATEAMTPAELLDFVSLRLPRRFLRDASTIAQRLNALDLQPDRDGRYRINELMCHDDTWRQAVESMMSSVDVILLDLRGFGPQNTGVVEELERLVALVPLHRVVAITDPTTNTEALRGALWRAAASAPPWSPLASNQAPMLRLAPSPDTRAGSRQLLQTLGAATAADQPFR